MTPPKNRENIRVDVAFKHILIMRFERMTGDRLILTLVLNNTKK